MKKSSFVLAKKDDVKQRNFRFRTSKNQNKIKTQQTQDTSKVLLIYQQ